MGFLRNAAGQPRAVLIGSSGYRRHSYGGNHPLGIPRVSLLLDLLHTYDALSAEEYVSTRAALPTELQRWHTAEYITALQQAQAAGRVTQAQRQSYQIGTLENPWFPEFFRVPATATYASIQGAERVLAGQMAFNPAGGMHHARPDRAQGFCFLNDPVLGILRLRDAGWRVLYLDLDAHHGDGVEAAFSDPQVLTVSLHMDTEYAYPFTGGGLRDYGPNQQAVNLPLPKGIDDATYYAAFMALWERCLQRFAPDVIVVQAGTDALSADPLGKLQLTTQGFLRVIAQVLADAPRHSDGTPRVLMLGGGGYHPLVLARCWAGVWGVMSGRELPVELPAAGQDLLRSVDWDLEDDLPDADEATLAQYAQTMYTRRLDCPPEGPVAAELRGSVEQRVAELLAMHPVLRREVLY